MGHRFLTMGNTVIVMIRMLKAIFSPTGCLFTLEMNAASLLLAPGLSSPYWRRCAFQTQKKKRARQSQSTFIKSAVLWVPTLPSRSRFPSFSEPLARVFILLIPHFFANDNYSNVCSNGCTCLIETDEINILNMLFFHLMKHPIT